MKKVLLTICALFGVYGLFAQDGVKQVQSEDGAIGVEVSADQLKSLNKAVVEGYFNWVNAAAEPMEMVPVV